MDRANFKGVGKLKYFVKQISIIMSAVWKQHNFKFVKLLCMLGHALEWGFLWIQDASGSNCVALFFVQFSCLYFLEMVAIVRWVMEFLKLRYFDKTSKIWLIFRSFLTLLISVKWNWKMVQIFVAFLEYLNCNLTKKMSV